MKSQLKRVAMLLVGWAFIVFGVIGLFLPILQGILFLIVGLIILSTEYHWANRLLERLKKRYPKVHQWSHDAAARADAWLRRLGRRNP